MRERYPRTARALRRLVPGIARSESDIFMDPWLHPPQAPPAFSALACLARRPRIARWSDVTENSPSRERLKTAFTLSGFMINLVVQVLAQLDRFLRRKYFQRPASIDTVATVTYAGHLSTLLTLVPVTRSSWKTRLGASVANQILRFFSSGPIPFPRHTSDPPSTDLPRCCAMCHLPARGQHPKS